MMNMSSSRSFLFSEFNESDDFIYRYEAFDNLDEELIDYGLQLMVSDAENLAAAERASIDEEAVSFPSPPPSSFCIFLLLNKWEQDEKLSQSILKDLWGRVSVAGRVVFYDRAFDEIRRYYHELWHYNQHKPVHLRLKPCVPIPRDAEAEVRSGLVSVKKGHLDRMRSYPTTYACFAKYYENSGAMMSHRDPIEHVLACRAEWNRLSRRQLRQLYQFQFTNRYMDNVDDLRSYVENLPL